MRNLRATAYTESISFPVEGIIAKAKEKKSNMFLFILTASKWPHRLRCLVLNVPYVHEIWNTEIENTIERCLLLSSV